MNVQLLPAACIDMATSLGLHLEVRGDFPCISTLYPWLQLSNLSWPPWLAGSSWVPLSTTLHIRAIRSVRRREDLSAHFAFHLTHFVAVRLTLRGEGSNIQGSMYKACHGLRSAHKQLRPFKTICTTALLPGVGTQEIFAAKWPKKKTKALWQAKLAAMPRTPRSQEDALLDVEAKDSPVLLVLAKRSRAAKRRLSALMRLTLYKLQVRNSTQIRSESALSCCILVVVHT